MYIPSFAVAIPVNYTSEFREIFEVTIYIWVDIYGITDVGNILIV